MRTLAACLAAAALASSARAQDQYVGAPRAHVDLGTRQGVAALDATWRYRNARIDEVDFHSPGPDNKPSGAKNRTYDVMPRPGVAGFDDGTWEAIDPTTLAARRSSGRVCFAWYRLALTLPAQLDGVAVAGSHIVFEIVVDDYAEVWVDGLLPRTLGQSGGSVVAGFNAKNRVVLARDAQPGQRIDVAVFAMNGPVSAAPENFIWVRSARLEVFAPEQVLPAPSFERLDPAFDAIVPRDATIEVIADNHAWVEGPAWHAGGYLFFTDIPRNAVYQWRPGAAAVPFLVPAGYTGSTPFLGREPGANGLTLDADGALFLCEHGDRRVSRLNADFTRTTVADRYGGKRLNSPNDVVVMRDGVVCFTDPPFGLPQAFVDPARELHFCGVYRVARDGRVTLLTDEVAAPNGLAFSPGERTLYVSNAEPENPVWLAFPLAEDGTLGEARVLFDARPWIGKRPGGPDGIKVDARGNLFTAGPGGVYVLTPDGKHLGTILTGSATSNCCLAEGGRTLFITAGTRVLRVGALAAGA
jgi:gluconolactonase